jgi:hypothetical protein
LGISLIDELNVWQQHPPDTAAKQSPFMAAWWFNRIRKPTTVAAQSSDSEFDYREVCIWRFGGLGNLQLSVAGSGGRLDRVHPTNPLIA